MEILMVCVIIFHDSQSVLPYDCWQQWKNAFPTAVQMYVPMKTIKNTNTPPYIDKEVRNLISRKYKALKNYTKV